jgi:hypothetical protein
VDSSRLREAWQPEPGPAAGLRVCVVGDILLDVVVRLDGLIQPDTDIYGHAVVGAGGQAANVGAGGQAANVAAWIVALGGSAALVGRHLIRQELRRHGVILHSPPAAPSTEPSSGLGREGGPGRWSRWPRRMAVAPC